jgi:hypothetical protein
MGTLGKAAGTAAALVFLLLTVLRPLVRNPALAGAGFEDIFTWPQVLVYAPLLFVVLSLLVLGILAFVRGDGVPTRESQQPVHGDRPAAGTGTDLDDPGPERFEDHPALSSRFHSDGGDATTAGDIEEEPPDATLSEHFEHLRTELDGDARVREELRTLEDVASETDEGSPIPARCPDCDAAWTERTILGVKTGRYERLDGQVVCLECESLYPLDRFA